MRFALIPEVSMKIAFACDHAGFEVKNIVFDFFKKKGFEYKDFGTFSSEACDYSDFAHPAALAVAKKEFDFGVFICGTGVGMCITANKIKGIRASLCHDTFTAKATREHNDSNVLCMGQRVIGIGLMLEILEAYFSSKFSNAERHINRIRKISGIENNL